LVAAREAPGRDSASASGLPSVREALVQELVSANCRRLAPEQRDPGPAQANDRGSLTGSVLALAPALVLARALPPASDRPLCPVSAVERVWGVEIELRTCRRRAETAPPVCKTAWPMPAATG
jgi:hypothetical protein